jgi:hypothetical protein
MLMLERAHCQRDIDDKSRSSEYCCGTGEGPEERRIREAGTSMEDEGERVEEDDDEDDDDEEEDKDEDDDEEEEESEADSEAEEGGKVCN